jgi:hypothetical protein
MKASIWAKSMPINNGYRYLDQAEGRIILGDLEKTLKMREWRRAPVTPGPIPGPDRDRVRYARARCLYLSSATAAMMIAPIRMFCT